MGLNGGGQTGGQSESEFLPDMRDLRVGHVGMRGRPLNVVDFGTTRGWRPAPYAIHLRTPGTR